MAIPYGNSTLQNLTEEQIKLETLGLNLPLAV